MREFVYGGYSQLTGEIFNDRKVQFHFVAKYPYINHIDVQFATYMRENNSRLNVTIYDEKKRVVSHLLVSCRDFTDNKYYRFNFGCDVTPGRVYELVLSSKDGMSGKSVTAKWGKHRHQETKTFYQSRRVEGELDCRIGYNTTRRSLVDWMQEARQVPTRIKSFLGHRNRMLSILILSKDNPKMVSECLSQIREHVKYEPYEIVIGDTGSTDQTVFDIYEKYGCRVIRDLDYHFSKNNNILAKHAEGDFLLFMNNDVFLIEDSVTKCMNYIMAYKIGSVGIRLVSPQGLIDHDGQLLLDEGLLREPDHIHINRKADDTEPRSCVFVDGNTGAFMMTRKELFEGQGGFDESFDDIYQDCDYALKLKQDGFEHVTIRSTSAIHIGSGTRGKGLTRETASKDRGRLEGRWKTGVRLRRRPTFSFVTCVNNESLYMNMINSLSAECVRDSEFIAIRNFDNYFTVTRALNVGRKLSRGKYIVYCHQDVEFGNKWRRYTLSLLDTIPNEEMGVVGFEGVKAAWVPYSCRAVSNTFKTEVLTLDELCLIVNNKELLFDEMLKFHFYGADLCCSANNSGRKNYLIGSNVEHKSGGDINIIKDPDAFISEAMRFWKKWTKRYPRVMTTTTKFTPDGPDFFICPDILNNRKPQ